MTAQRWRLAVVAELVLGAVLGSLFLGTHSLFLDESVSSTLATAPWHFFANTVSHREANMALYYLLLRGWVVFGHGEIALRSLSVILAVGALWVVIMLARSLFGRRVALLAGLLLAIDPLYVQFAQDVRGYSLALLLVSAVLLLLRPGHPPGGPTVPVLLDGLHRRHGPRRLQQFLGRARPRRAGAVAGLPPRGADPMAPRAGVGASHWSSCWSRSACSSSRPTAPASIGRRARRPAASSRTSARPSPTRCSTRSCSSPPSRSSRSSCSARRRPAIGAVFARQWPLFFTAVLARRAGGRRRDAVAGRQATPRGALPDGQPSGGDPPGRAW